MVKHKLMTASIVHVANMTPGSKCNPTGEFGELAAELALFDGLVP
jgi:hypothetical protein